jgi:hypothetical protein
MALIQSKRMIKIAAMPQTPPSTAPRIVRLLLAPPGVAEEAAFGLVEAVDAGVAVRLLEGVASGACSPSS